MSEYLHVEKPFLEQLAELGWKVTDQGQGFIPTDPGKSLRTTFREWFLPEVFRDAVRTINLTPDSNVVGSQGIVISACASAWVLSSDTVTPHDALVALGEDYLRVSG